MAVAGISCPSCHQAREISATGNVLWRASTAVCSQCHDEAAMQRLSVSHEQLKHSLVEIDAELSRARQAVAGATLGELRAAEITQRLRDLEDDLQFLRVGNSIHNMHYADSLTVAIVDKLTAICRELNIAEPTIDTPTGAGLQVE
jgi:predicted CXXCH cytochrome family protein